MPAHLTDGSIADSATSIADPANQPEGGITP